MDIFKDFAIKDKEEQFYQYKLTYLPEKFFLEIFQPTFGTASKQQHDR